MIKNPNQTHQRELTPTATYKELVGDLRTIGQAAEGRGLVPHAGAFLGLAKHVELESGGEGVLTLRALPGTTGLDRNRAVVSLIDASEKAGTSTLTSSEVAANVYDLGGDGTVVSYPSEYVRAGEATKRAREAIDGAFGSPAERGEDAAAALNDFALEADSYAILEPGGKVTTHSLEALYPTPPQPTAEQ